MSPSLQHNKLPIGRKNISLNGFSYKDPKTGRKWKKVLYERNSYPDNYTPDECFLAAIEKNKNLHSFTFSQCLLGSCQVALQGSIVILFGVIYNLLDSESITAESLLIFITVMSILCYVISELSSHLRKSLWDHWKDLKLVIIFVSFGIGLSPVLFKLTDTISTDSIHSMTSVMLFIHLVFQDYGLQVSIVSSPLSLNAGLFAAICLASRLQSSFDAFALLSLAVATFVLFPRLRNHLQGNLLLATTAFVSIFAITLTAFVSVSLSVLACSTLNAVIFLCPTLFVHWQEYKTTIHGPWDEAIPSI